MDPLLSIPPDRLVLAPSDRRAAVIDIIRQARARLSLSLFRCNDKEIFRELRAAVDRGVDVEVLVTSRAKGGRKKLRKLWQRLEATGAVVHAYNDPVVKYHAKYVVADDGPALVASLNFTRKCFAKTCDAVVITHDPQVVSSLRQLMSTDRDGIAAPDAMTNRVILGPERARRQFTHLIEQARASILLIDAKLSDPGILALLEERRAAGVAVHVHDAGRVGSLKSHGKIMLIDGERAVIGSLALTALSLDFRREVALEIIGPAAVADIQSLFQSIGVTAPGPVPAAAAGGASC
ncbi:MAG TPA: phospholipase D-like domain-containing protein [Vicinamibacterales bacterium]|nr:phospholipase D-like domain-containing protein [Vicinamibacterales bacterium]